MTDTDDELQALRARCGRYLARLAVLAGGPPGTPLPRGTAARVTEAVNAVVAQAEAAGQAVLPVAADGRQKATREFLAARLIRLKAVAGDTITAARDGDLAALHAQLRQLDAMTAALWTVHEAVAISAPAPPGAGRAASPLPGARGPPP